MNPSLYAWLTEGLVRNDWLVLLIVFAVVAQFTILSVTIYLHRCQAHRGVDLHPIVSHPMRFWLWLTTAMVTRDWVAIHRKHHAHCETENDPHSPVILGINKVVFHGVTLYQDARRDPTIGKQYGAGTPTDWLERGIYGRYPSLGPTVLLFAYIALFGVIGVTLWALQMLVIPVAAAGVINGVGHWWGYRNFETDDCATNITPWAVLLGGEELHNNHHAFPSSARFALRRFELDIGWAALPPTIIWDDRDGCHDRGVRWEIEIRDSCWVWVSHGKFYSRHIHQVCEHPRQNRTRFGNASYRGCLGAERGRPMNRAIGYDDAERYTGQKGPRRKVKDQKDDKGRPDNRDDGESVIVFRPKVKKNKPDNDKEEREKKEREEKEKLEKEKADREKAEREKKEKE